MNELIIVEQSKASVVYAKMQAAIAECYDIDDCKNIANHASAIAAYYQEIRDDETVRKFFSIKLRAWRRIGEICAKIKRNTDESQTAHHRRISELYNNIITYSQITTAIRLAEVPIEYFEKAMITDGGSASRIIYGYQAFLRQQWENSPEGKAELKKQEEAIKAARVKEEELRTKENEENKERIAEAVFMQDKQKTLWKEFVEASAEVGYTMDRRDRKTMKSVVLLLNSAVHGVLRKAAFEKHMTMQGVLRRGLETWLICNGYDVPK